MSLRPYQQQAITDIRAAFTSSRSVLYCLPTGGGKTHIFVEVAERVIKRGGRVLVLEHRGELVAQAVRKLRGVGINPGVISASYRGASFTGFEQVVVATVQTLAKRTLPSHWRPDFIIADECHLACAATWRQLLQQRFARCWRLGVTATPERLDGQGLGGVFRTMVLGPTIGKLTEAGHLVPALVYAPPAPDLSGVAIRGGEFAVRAAAAAMTGLVGDVVQHYHRLGAGRQALIFAASISHAEQLQAGFGAGFATVTGKTPAKQRSQTLADLASGAITGVINVGVLVEGFDCPAVSYIALARPTASTTVYLQSIGRGLRPAPGKADCIIADHAGNASERFGLPDQDRQWSLTGRGKRTRGVDPDALAITTCPGCFALYHGHTCPRCGHSRPVQQRRLRQAGGLLRPLTKAELQQRQRQQSHAMPERPAPYWAPPALWARLEAKRKREGYQPGWTIGTCRARMGGRR